MELLLREVTQESHPGVCIAETALTEHLPPTAKGQEIIPVCTKEQPHVGLRLFHSVKLNNHNISAHEIHGPGHQPFCKAVISEISLGREPEGLCTLLLLLLLPMDDLEEACSCVPHSQSWGFLP